MIKLPPIKEPNQKFVGIKIRHSYISLWILENVLDDIKPNKIVELGTGKGALTVFLGVWARNNRAHILTVDNDKKLQEYKTLKFIVDCLPVSFHHGDMFGDKIKLQIKNWIELDNEPVFIYCDGGDKTKELQFYSDLIPIGSVIGCHDYGTEVFYGIAEDFMKQNGFEPIVDKEIMRKCYSLQMFWKRVRLNESKYNNTDIQAA